ncbi:MAG: exodeoxyribonuclease VII small subunit [Verrucomicrobiales bacterium]|nr:exodeoxyribonuclease VII small subunit [Verrucomicrobiales bacterium]
MPKSSTSGSSPDESDVPFEDALAQLEELVGEMESGQMPLEELISNYENGTRLFQLCAKQLDAAEGRIEMIRKNRNGESVVETFDDEASPAAPTTESSSDDADEESPDENGELF